MINSNYSNTPSFTGMFKIPSCDKYDSLRGEILGHVTKGNFFHADLGTVRMDVTDAKKTKSLLNLLVQKGRSFCYCNETGFSKKADLTDVQGNIKKFDRHF